MAHGHSRNYTTLTDATMRPGVCYVGLVFKLLQTTRKTTLVVLRRCF
jgi:hypothetical protein